MAETSDHGAALGRVLELTVLLGEDMAQFFAREGLTGPRAHLLWELEQRGPSTQKTLADALGVTPRNITGLVDGLVATGFVSRQPHPTDRRATLVTLTDRGARTAAGFVTGRAALAEQLFGGMPTPVLAHLLEGLDIVLERLRAALAEAAEERR